MTDSQGLSREGKIDDRFKPYTTAELYTCLVECQSTRAMDVFLLHDYMQGSGQIPKPRDAAETLLRVYEETIKMESSFRMRAPQGVSDGFEKPLAHMKRRLIKLISETDEP